MRWLTIADLSNGVAREVVCIIEGGFIDFVGWIMSDRLPVGSLT